METNILSSGVSYKVSGKVNGRLDWVCYNSIPTPRIISGPTNEELRFSKLSLFQMPVRSKVSR
jgi:hypothetical protein